ncbi:TIGR03503 family protein [Thalassotalea piscium]
MAKLGCFRSLVGILFYIQCYQVGAQQSLTEIEYYKNDNVTNQIPILDNRFRIDAQLEEVTLLFYRKSGSQPIILIRPDGTKIKVNNYPKEEVEWFDDRTYDLIRMKKPMIGPWQAVGNISPDSKIMVITDVRIEVDPLPETILAGETLKVYAKLFNSEKAIDDPRFDDVIDLDIDFYSTNNSNYDNFGAKPVAIGSFRDDGYELDEHAKDGIFTAEFELNFAPGEWVPIYRVKMPMANRELRQKPIILHPVPVTMSVDKTVNQNEYHKLKFHIDNTYVDPDSMIFQGKITYPDKQVDPISITEGQGVNRTKKILFTEPGMHRLNINAFGETIDGREFRLVLPEFTFNVERKSGVQLNELSDGTITSEENQLQTALAIKEASVKKLQEELAQAKIKYEQEEAAKKEMNIMIAIIVNLVIILAAGVAFFIIRRKKNSGNSQ